MDNKGYLQISFAWLFAIIVGAVIIFFSIFFVSKMIKTEGVAQSAEAGKEIGILLNPLETGFESTRTTSIAFPTETRIYNKCDLYGTFGNQGISIEQKNFNKWVETDIDVTFPNKYIFSDFSIEGKTFYIFSKPFEFPFKVADLIYMTSSKDDYCFIKAPEEILEEISDMNQPNLKFEDCIGGSINVCFEKSNCDINVNYDAKYVSKEGKRMYFEGDSLMYAAIFSSEENYECHLQRLMKRTEQLSKIYIDKEQKLSLIGCDSSLSAELVSLKNAASELENSETINLVKNIADNLEEENRGDCKLW